MINNQDFFNLLTLVLNMNTIAKLLLLNVWTKRFMWRAFQSVSRKRISFIVYRLSFCVHFRISFDKSCVQRVFV
jgi:hypothetical protein